MKKKLLEVAHDIASDLYQAGGLDLKTMREFDAVCLPKIKKYSPLQIKRLRLQNRASQAVFAAYLNMSASTVQQWEQGQKMPNGLALRVLNLIEKKGLAILSY